jgi:glycosyltransferase involved in cell wall biosynthesis
MAVYRPNPAWLREQLASIERQDYPNLELLILDDCSGEESVRQTKECVAEEIHRIPCSFGVNEHNLGSTKTFEELTLRASGQYIAYCDQDDIWLPQKLTRLHCQIEEAQADLVFSDMFVIDGGGTLLSDSMTKVRKRHVFPDVENASRILLYHNFVVGCTMLMRAETAKKSVPFLGCMVHDHYLALYAAVNGTLSFCEEPLIQYRMHGGNQTGVLAGVGDKASYYRNRVALFDERTRAIAERFSFPALEEAIRWNSARLAFFKKEPRARTRYWQQRAADSRTTLFELICWNLPERLFEKVLSLIQRNKI